MTGRIIARGRRALSMWAKGRRLLLGSAVVFVLLAGGVAYATIPDPGAGLIHGCYSLTTGALRVVDPSKGGHCVKGEGGLNWNQRGINWRGSWSATAHYAVNDAVAYNGSSWLANVANVNSAPSGPSWSTLAQQGAPGGTGPPGISTGIFTQSSTSVALNQVQTLTTVLTSPAATTAGDYYINASVMLVVAQADTVACILAHNGGSFGEFATVGPAANQTYETVPLAGDVALSPGDTVSVQCTGYTGNAATSFYDGALTGTLINTDVHARPPGARGSVRLPLSIRRTVR